MVFIFKKHHIFKKLLLISLIGIIFFVASGLGILAMPKKAKAIGPVFDIKQILNNLLVSIWKSVLFPLIKEIIVSYITTGEFPMNMDEFKTWLVEDLLFQTMNSVIGEFANFDLCSEFSMNIRIALGQNALSPDRQPECTFDQSHWMQTLERAYRERDEGGDLGEILSEDMRENFLENFAISAQGANNQYGTWWNAQDRVNAEATRQENQYNIELSANRGFLGQRDCSRGTDRNHDGEVSGDECPTTTTGETVASALEDYNDYTKGAIQTEVFSDLIALFGNVIDLVINQAIQGGISAISNWGSSRDKRRSATEYKMEAMQKIGENMIIEY